MSLKRGGAMLDIVLIVLMALAGVIATAYYASDSSPQPSVQQKRTAIRAMRQELSQLQAAPNLPDLDHSWRHVKANLTHCGLEPSTLDADKKATLYKGQAPFWSAVVSGAPVNVLSCLITINARYPVVFDSVQITDSKKRILSIRFSVYGRVNTDVADAPT